MNWNDYYTLAEKYYRRHGNLSVPKNYEEDGVNLSHWIWAQRRRMLGTDPDRKLPLTEEQVRRLESIGMVWAPKSKGFRYYYDQARKFYEAYGHTDFPAGDVYIDGELLPESGEQLQEWKREQEKYLQDYYKLKKEQNTEEYEGQNTEENEEQNTEEHIKNDAEKGENRFPEKIKKHHRGTYAARRKLLYEIGINPTGWEIPWEKNYRCAEEYYRTHGDLLVPFYYKTDDGIALGKWISQQRLKKKKTQGTLSEDQIERLEKIGMVWDTGGKRTRRGGKERVRRGVDERTRHGADERAKRGDDEQNE